jgi:hypothetical protein
MKLNQLIAILQSVKTNAAKGKTEVYQVAGKLLEYREGRS